MTNKPDNVFEKKKVIILAKMEQTLEVWSLIKFNKNRLSQLSTINLDNSKTTLVKSCKPLNFDYLISYIVQCILYVHVLEEKIIGLQNYLKLVKFSRINFLSFRIRKFISNFSCSVNSFKYTSEYKPCFLWLKNNYTSAHKWRFWYQH